MLPADYMDVQVVDALAAMTSIVDYSSEPVLGQAFLSCNLRSNDHEVTEQGLVPILSLMYLCQPVAVLRNHEKVRGSDRSNVTECQASIILVEYVRRNLLPDEFIKDSILSWFGFLSFGLLVTAA